MRCGPSGSTTSTFHIPPGGFGRRSPKRTAKEGPPRKGRLVSCRALLRLPYGEHENRLKSNLVEGLRIRRVQRNQRWQSGCAVRRNPRQNLRFPNANTFREYCEGIQRSGALRLNESTQCDFLRLAYINAHGVCAERY